jgi:PAS domain S-box-containing protein
MATFVQQYAVFLGVLAALLFVGISVYVWVRVRAQNARLEQEVAARTATLRESERQYHLLAENMVDVIWTLDPHTLRFTYVSPSVLKLRGFTPEEVLAQSIEEVVTPKSLALIQAGLPDTIQRYLAGERDELIQINEIEQYCKGSGTVWTEVATTFMQCDDGSLEVVGVSRNIDKRHRAEAALRKSEERFATVVNSINAFIYVATMDTHEVLFINQHAHALFGNVVGQTCWQVLQAGQTGPCPFCTNRYLLDEEGQPTGPYTWEFQNTRTGYWYHIQNQAIRWTDGRLVRLEVASDITKVKEAEVQRQRLAVLEERERIGQDLHDDLGQMMSYIAVQTQAVQEHLEDTGADVLRAMLARVLQASQRASADLRTYILGIRSQSAPPTTDFVTALQAYGQELRAQYGLDVQLSLPDALQTISLLPQVETQLLRIVQEALTNARRHADVQLARITVTLHSDEVQVMIADDGVGFDASPYLPDAAPEGQRQAAETGAGFGLHIMRERAVSVGGSLEVRSVPGAGTQVIVRVPCGAPAAAPVEKPWQSWRVLLADDHALFLAGLRNLLQARGVQVVGLARNGEEAQTLARTTHPDLILMDVHMPACDGLEATRIIHAEMPDVKIVMLTVEADDDALFGALKAGASGYLLKALQSEPFFELLAQVMQGEVTLSPGLASRVLTEFSRQTPQSVAAPVGRETTPAFAALTERQLEILDLVARGLTYKEIGQKLYLSERTVRYHMGQILESLQLENRHAAVVYARQKGMGLSG